MKVELHQISRCGFYERGGNQSPLFGQLASWQQQLINWVQGRSNVALTTTFQGQDAQAPEVYCAGAIQSRDGFGLILWHGTPGTENGVAYINMNDLPGAVNVREVSLGANSIPGWPSYFWILPQQSLLACLRPTGKIRNLSTGLPECRRYLEGWLCTQSRYAVRVTNNDQADGAEFELAWRSTPDSASRTDVTVHVDTQPVTTPRSVDEIRSRYDQIRKLVHSVQIHRSLPADRSMLTRLMAVMGFDGISTPDTDRLAFRWESDWRPKLAELESLIARQNANNENGRKERQAVRLKGDSRLYWLDGGPVRDEVALPDNLEHSLHWSPQQLAQAWDVAAASVEDWLRYAEF